MVCPNCGTVNGDDAKFCTKCGTAVNSANDAQPCGDSHNSNYQNTSYQNQQNSYNSGYSQSTVPVNNVYVQQPTSPAEHVSIGAWIGVFVLSIIPLVNIIMLLVWAFGGTTKPSLKNYARAQLIVVLIVIVLFIIVGVSFASFAGSAYNSYHYYY